MKNSRRFSTSIVLVSILFLATGVVAMNKDNRKVTGKKRFELMPMVVGIGQYSDGTVVIGGSHSHVGSSLQTRRALKKLSMLLQSGSIEREEDDEMVLGSGKNSRTESE